jgi:quercetin dioxygenase-like cupin family protein
MPNNLSHVAHFIHAGNLGRFDILGPTIQFVTEPSDGDAPCIMRGTIRPGISIPLHSHPDPETLFVLSGKLRALTFPGEDFAWVEIKPGEIFHVPGGAKHAFRNEGQTDAVVIIVSSSKIGRFFQEVGVPTPLGARPHGPPSADQMKRFLATASRYRYWNATPEDNARVGIVMAPV